jgi:CRP-like cAMP-binding protein
MTHEELAGLLGASRERVTKALGQLQAAGLIACGRRPRGIRLLQPDRLRAL